MEVSNWGGGAAPYWAPDLGAAEGAFAATADRLATEVFAPAAERWDRTGEYAAENVTALIDSGLATMFVERRHGGGGATVTATTAVLERIAADCASTATILSTLLLGAVPVQIHGTEEQQADVFGRFVHERQALSFALTERGAGSDLRSITTTAAHVDDGYRLNGEKWLIGNGGQAGMYTVFAQLEGRGLTAFLVDAHADGLHVDHVHRKMGIRGTATTNLRLDNVTVGARALLGVEGGGARVALSGLDLGRIAVAATATGLGIGAFVSASRRAAERVQFGRPVFENQALAFRLADIATELSAARLITYDAAARADRGSDLRTAAAMAKLHASEVSHRAVDTAVQVYGGIGYTADSPVDRMYRDQRGYELAEGTSEILRLVISRSVRQWLSEGMSR